MKLFKKSDNKPVRQARAPETANVFSYYASRSPSDNTIKRQNNKQPAKKSRRFLNWQTLPIAVAAFVILMSLGYLLWLDINPRIEVIASSPENKEIMQETEVYRQAGEELLSKSPFNRIKLTIDTNKLASDFMDRFPELSDVSITTPLAGHRLIFEIQPTTPTLALSANASDFIILDERGRALFQTSMAERVSKLGMPVIIDESGIEVKVGDNVLPRESVNFITEVVRQLQAKSIPIQSINLPAIANELHIRPANQNYYIKFNIVGDPRLQAGAFIATKERLDEEGKTPGTYIDVRTQEKVYYK